MEFSLGPDIESYIAMARSKYAMEFNWAAVAFRARKTEEDVNKASDLFLVNKDAFYFILSMAINLRTYSHQLTTHWKRIVESSCSLASKYFNEPSSEIEEILEFCDNPHPSELHVIQNGWCSLQLINADCSEIEERIIELFGSVSALWNDNLTYGWTEENFDRRSYVPFNVVTSVNELVREPFHWQAHVGWFFDWDKIGAIIEHHIKEKTSTGGIDFSKRDFMEKETCQICNQKIKAEYRKVADFDFPEYYQIKAAIKCEKELLAMTQGNFIAFIEAYEDKKSDIRKYCNSSQQKIIERFCDNPTSEALYEVQRALLIMLYVGVYWPNLEDRFNKIIQEKIATETDPEVNWDPTLAGYGKDYIINITPAPELFHESQKCFHTYL